MSLPKIQGETARLWDDPQLRSTKGGKAACSLPLVFNKRKKNQAGEWEDAGSVFVRGTAWDQLGENCADSLAKGDEVIVTGELSVREFERNDGSKGQSLELNVYALGASLRSATAKVMRAERGSSNPQGNGTPDGDPWPTAAADDELAPFETAGGPG